MSLPQSPARLGMFLLFLLDSAGWARATDKCGELCDEAWDVAGSPYVVTCDVTVSASCALGIDPGITVRFQADTGLIVDGQLSVGTGTAPVMLTSDAESPISGDWTGLEFRAGPVVDLGAVTCSVAGLNADRWTDTTEAASPGCADGNLFWLMKPTGSPDYGANSSGLPRSMTSPDPACP